MSRDLRHEYTLLKEQYVKGDAARDRGMREIADAYIQILDDKGLMPQPLMVPLKAEG